MASPSIPLSRKSSWISKHSNNEIASVQCCAKILFGVKLCPYAPWQPLFQTAADPQTALFNACETGDAARVATLLQNSNVDVNAIDPTGQKTPLHIAYGRGYLSIVQTLLAHHALLESRDPLGNTPLQITCSTGTREILNALLEAGANPNTVNDFDVPALHTACQNRDHNVAWDLVRKGADIAAPGSQGYTPLHIALPDLKGTLPCILPSGIISS